MLYLAGPALFITLTLATLEGAVAYGYFTSLGCDPLKAKQISNPNQVRFYKCEKRCTLKDSYPGKNRNLVKGHGMS